MVKLWSDKRYHSWNWHLRQEFGEKVAKISLDAGFSCPNRDPDSGGGCIYCSPRGSGDCAGDREISVSQQFLQVKERMLLKWPKTTKFIAYFQAYTNTLAPIAQLEKLYNEALLQPGVVGLSISTRPDCLPLPVLDLLEELNKRTWLWVELGLQSSHDSTLNFINRGHTYQDFLKAVDALRARGIRVCTHVILGLPGETQEMVDQTISRVSNLDVQGIKFHQLLVVRDTKLSMMWQQGQVPLQEMDQYVQQVVRALELIPPEMVVQRMTGDAPREILLAPLWTRRKWETLQAIEKALVEGDTWQGKKYLCYN